MEEIFLDLNSTQSNRKLFILKRIRRHDKHQKSHNHGGNRIFYVVVEVYDGGGGVMIVMKSEVSDETVPVSLSHRFSGK